MSTLQNYSYSVIVLDNKYQEQILSIPCAGQQIASQVYDNIIKMFPDANIILKDSLFNSVKNKKEEIKISPKSNIIAELEKDLFDF